MGHPEAHSSSPQVIDDDQPSRRTRQSMKQGQRLGFNEVVQEQGAGDDIPSPRKRVTQHIMQKELGNPLRLRFRLLSGVFDRCEAHIATGDSQFESLGSGAARQPPRDVTAATGDIQHSQRLPALAAGRFNDGSPQTVGRTTEPVDSTQRSERLAMQSHIKIRLVHHLGDDAA